jgi:hypothetical protein
MKYLLTLCTTLFLFLGNPCASWCTDPNHEANYLCSLPAPTGLRVSSVKTNSASLRWNPIGGAILYNVKAYKLPANTLVANYNTAGTSTTVNGLEAGKTYRFVVAGICASGQISNNASNVLKTIIVLDLVLNQNTNERLPKNMVKLPFNKCFRGNWYEGNSNEGEHYLMELHQTITNNSAWYHIALVNDFIISVSEITEGVENPFESSDIQAGISPDDAILYANSNPVCTLTLQQNINSASNTGVILGICSTMLPAGYELNFYATDAFELQGNTLDREKEMPSEENNSQLLTCFPNPVRDILTFQIRPNVSVPVRVQLLSLDGTLIWAQQILNPASNQGIVYLGDLSRGVYLLRANNDKEQLSIRVVKTD